MPNNIKAEAWRCSIYLGFQNRSLRIRGRNTGRTGANSSTIILCNYYIKIYITDNSCRNLSIRLWITDRTRKKSSEETEFEPQNEPPGTETHVEYCSPLQQGILLRREQCHDRSHNVSLHFQIWNYIASSTHNREKLEIRTEQKASPTG